MYAAQPGTDALFALDDTESDDNQSMGEAQRQSFNMLSNILATGKSEAIINKDLGEITIDAGHTGKSGFGLKHIIEQRFLKDKASEQDITALLHLVKDAAQSGDATREISRIKNVPCFLICKHSKNKRKLLQEKSYAYQKIFGCSV